MTPGWAALIGVLAGGVCYGAVLFKEKMGWDDALDVWAVHGVGGILGSILTGMFATPALGAAGLVYGGVSLFFANLAAAVISAAYAFGMTWLILKVLGAFQAPEAGNRRAGSGPRPHLPRRTRPRPRLT